MDAMPPEELEQLTKEELLDRAAELDIEGRTQMKKAELADAIANRLAHDPARAEQAQQQVVDASTDTVPRTEYERVVNENATLRQQLQQAVSGTVGVSQPGAPPPNQP